MKEKIAKIMRSGGYAVILATIAMSAYLCIIRWGEKYLSNQAVPLKIQIDENGYLSTNYGGEKKNVYIIWQTDGGQIQPVEKNEKLSRQFTNDNKWYFAYTGSNEKIKWSPDDFDGNRYTTVNIRATLYYSSSDDDVFYISNYINEASITISLQNDKIVKADDRLFSNPIREGETEWSQIYMISSESSNTMTFAYRTGMDIDKPEEKILIWEGNDEILNQTDLKGGTVGEFSVDSENTGKNIIKASAFITINPQNIRDKLEISAYLTSKENVEKNSEEIKEKLYAALLNVAERKK